MGGLGYSRTGKGARIEQISRDMRVMVVGGGSEEILTELAFAQEERNWLPSPSDGKASFSHNGCS